MDKTDDLVCFCTGVVIADAKAEITTQIHMFKWIFT